MQRRIHLALLSLLLLGGCASYKPTATPIVQANDSDLVFNKEGYGAKVDPYLEESRQKSYFNANFTKAGFLVVDVLVKNEGKDPIEVRPYDIYLVFPGGNQMAPLQGQVVATQVEENGSVVGSVLMFGIVGGLVATQAEHDAKNARILDYGAKQLKETTLAPGGSTQGFLFYRWTPSPSAQAEFVLQLQDKTNDQISDVTIPFGNTKVFSVNQSAAFVPSAAPAPTASTTPTASVSPQIAPGPSPPGSSQNVPSSAALAPSAGPVDVPLTIDIEGQSYEGVGRLENGHLAGQVQSGNKAITLSGEIRGSELSVVVRGALNRRSSYDAPGNSECVASGSARAAGKITLPMLATCGNGNVPTHVTPQSGSTGGGGSIGTRELCPLSLPLPQPSLSIHRQDDAVLHPAFVPARFQEFVLLDLRGNPRIFCPCITE